MHFNNLRNQDPGDYAGCTTIIDSIEKCWAKADQDVFIAAVILNPFFKCGPFSSEARSWSEASILALLQRLYKRFFSFTEREDELEVNLNTLYSNVGEYLASEGQGICDGMTPYVKGMELTAATPGSKSNLDPLQVYRAMTPQNMAPSPLLKLANHILSICPNSASCKRLFSIFGNTLTKLRNCLGNQTLTSLAELKMHIRDEHLRSNETKSRVKRLFSADNTSSSSAIISPAPDPSAIVSPAADPSAIVSPAAAPSAVSPVVDPQLEALSTPAQAVYAAAAAALPLTSATNTDDMMDIDPNVLQPSTSNNAGDDFAHIVQTFANLSSGDEDEEGALPPSQIPISHLFDFSKNYWVLKQGRSASRSLDEHQQKTIHECNLYSLHSAGSDFDDPPVCLLW